MMDQKLLVVVDMQKDFITGALGFEKAETIAPVVVEHILKAKNDGTYQIVVTQDTHPEHYLETREGQALPVNHCIKNTTGWELDESIQKVLEGTPHLLLEKPSFGLDGDAIMKIKDAYGNRFNEIHLCGLVSNICVLSNAVVFQANFPEATICVDARATASFDDQLNQCALTVLEGLQVKITNR